ncbi:MAG: CDP-glucose 4,6-dehydratase [Chitinophagaceae bacterium]|nr:CDP-glucose 4,6-dehydratase [Chitinophagaceae bacterium]
MAHQPDLEEMVSFNEIRSCFEGKKVLLTGHTGFKGTWLLQILSMAGADITGLALAPETENDLYVQVNGDRLCHSIIHDIRDAKKVRDIIAQTRPDFIFHLAAQPLVLKGYNEPLYTFEVNTQGTANVMDALRFTDHPCVAVMITTDKVYENHDEPCAFKESDKLGGYDPYSASKAACEIVINSYRSSFFNPDKYSIHRKSIASVRAGNVIGGGDFSANRIIPDIVRSLKHDESILLRNPHATRPWQHVIEPLGAYLLLAMRMAESPEKFNTSYNIGPYLQDVISVEALTQIAIQTAGRGQYHLADVVPEFHEAATLMLDISKISSELGWTPHYSSQEAIAHTIAWYMDDRDASIKCIEHIRDYFQNSSPA